jgi:hypothetical protein
VSDTARPRPAAAELPDTADVGALGVCQLKRLWARSMATRRGERHAPGRDAHQDPLVLHALGLGLEPTLQHLMRAGPDFAAFEQWIVATTGGIAPERIERINAALLGLPPPPAAQRRIDAVAAAPPVLAPADLAFWEEHGYVVLHDAVPPRACAEAEHAVWRHVGARPDDPSTWYRGATQGIMVQLFQDPALEANRRSPRIHKAFSQLWGTADLWVSTDRAGFNPPERDGFTFPGPHLHWDVSLQTPIPFGVQGMLYLADASVDQGAFTLVPGFHRRVDDWLAGLPADADRRAVDLRAQAIPIGGRAGDLVIWHHALPHGASPNRATRPRIVQYLTMFPFDAEARDVWK